MAAVFWQLSNKCTIYFKTPDTLSTLGVLHFDRFLSGKAGTPATLGAEGSTYANGIPWQWAFLGPSRNNP